MDGECIRFKYFVPIIVILLSALANCTDQRYGHDRETTDAGQRYVVNFNGLVTDITDNQFDRSGPSIYGNLIAFTQRNDSSTQNNQTNADLFVYDLSTKEIILEIPAISINSGPIIYKNTIVWIGNGHRIVFAHNITTGENRIISDFLSTKAGLNIWEDKIVWHDTRNDIDSEGHYNLDIYMFDLSLNQEFQITNEVYFQACPSIYGDYIVWHEEYEYEGKSHIVIYNLKERRVQEKIISDYEHCYPKISGNYIVWQNCYSSYYDTKIELYNVMTKERKVISLGPWDGIPRIQNNIVVWADNNASNILLYNIYDGKTIRLTDNTGGWYNNSPAIYYDKVVWCSVSLPARDTSVIRMAELELVPVTDC